MEIHTVYLYFFRLKILIWNYLNISLVIISGNNIKIL